MCDHAQRWVDTLNAHLSEQRIERWNLASPRHFWLIYDIAVPEPAMMR
jgi:hypothetical protein